MDLDLDQITDAAQRLGIRLTSAKEGTEAYRLWADRVARAHAAWQNSESVDVINAWVVEADTCAIDCVSGCPEKTHINARVVGLDIVEIDDDGNKYKNWNNWECSCTLALVHKDPDEASVTDGGTAFCGDFLPMVLVRRGRFWRVLRDGRDVLFDNDTEDAIEEAALLCSE